jgi:hypothetical protein
MIKTIEQRQVKYKAKNYQTEELLHKIRCSRGSEYEMQRMFCWSSWFSVMTWAAILCPLLWFGFIGVVGYGLAIIGTIIMACCFSDKLSRTEQEFLREEFNWMWRLGNPIALIFKKQYQKVLIRRNIKKTYISDDKTAFLVNSYQDKTLNPVKQATLVYFYTQNSLESIVKDLQKAIEEVAASESRIAHMKDPEIAEILQMLQSKKKDLMGKLEEVQGNIKTHNESFSELNTEIQRLESIKEVAAAFATLKSCNELEFKIERKLEELKSLSCQVSAHAELMRSGIKSLTQ